MTAQIIKIKVFNRAVVKTKANVVYPARLIEGPGIDIEVANGAATIGLDYLAFAPTTTFDPAQYVVALQNSVDASFIYVPLLAFLTNPGAIRRVTEAGDITVSASTQLLLMDRTADESPSNIIMPAAASKIGACKVVDWKGNAGSFPHTISLNGSEEFQGGLTTWTLGGDGASVVLDPAPGLGYAV